MTILRMISGLVICLIWPSEVEGDVLSGTLVHSGISSSKPRRARTDNVRMRERGPRRLSSEMISGTSTVSRVKTVYMGLRKISELRSIQMYRLFSSIISTCSSDLIAPDAV